MQITHLALGLIHIFFGDCWYGPVLSKAFDCSVWSHAAENLCKWTFGSWLIFWPYIKDYPRVDNCWAHVYLCTM